MTIKQRILANARDFQRRLEMRMALQRKAEDIVFDRLALKRDAKALADRMEKQGLIKRNETAKTENREG